MLWLKNGICAQICHYLHSTKDKDNPILYIYIYTLPKLFNSSFLLSLIFSYKCSFHFSIWYFYILSSNDFFISKNLCSHKHYTFKNIAYENYQMCIIASRVACTNVKEENIVLFFILNFVPYESWDRVMYIFSNEILVNNIILIKGIIKWRKIISSKIQS